MGEVISRKMKVIAIDKLNRAVLTKRAVQARVDGGLACTFWIVIDAEDYPNLFVLSEKAIFSQPKKKVK